ncbi:MAG TPA: HD domain-containing protein [Candidatus Gracilibacteria bacterium]
MTHQNKYNWEKDYQDILASVSNYYPIKDTEKQRLKKAFEFAAKVHKDQFEDGNKAGPYIAHPIRIAKQLLELQPDLDTIIAAILHGVLYKTATKREVLEQNFGETVAFLCEKITQIWPLTLKAYKENDDYTKQLFLGIAQDVRVLYIQLADIIDNLQCECFLHEGQDRIFAENALNLYAPIAQKLNLYNFKQQLEDYSFKKLSPETYQNIKHQINAHRRERQNFIEQSVESIKELLDAEKIPFVNVYGRTKNFYSIYTKMKRKNYTSVNDVYDLFAIRIITNKENNCYRILGAIHGHWKPLPHRFKDYVAVPKPNGYQSLHTTILGLVGSSQPTEIQIKTQEMDQLAEFGSASHWAYKKRKGSHFDEAFVKKNDWISQHNHEDPSMNYDQMIHNLSQTVFEERIHVFTPQGEIKNLPKGATPIDFAYAVHSQVGNTTIGAKVNGRIAPLNYELKAGDVVEIMTKSGRQPNPLWLNFVKSSQAKSKIKNHLNRIESQDELPKKEKAPLKDTVLLPKIKKTVSLEVPDQKSPILIGGTKTKSYRMAQCCNPKAYQNIVAFNSRGLEFTIHRQSCKMLEPLEKDRIMEANFLRKLKFKIMAEDRVGILREITDCISGNNINILICNHKVSQKDKVDLNFEIEYIFDDEISNLFEQLREIPNVEEITICTTSPKPKTKKSGSCSMGGVVVLKASAP